MSATTEPLMLVHQESQRAAELPPVAIAAQRAGVRSPGLLLSWDHAHRDAVADLAANAGLLDPLLADPGAVAYGRATFGPWKKDMARWVGRAAPSTATEWDRTVEQALRAQRRLDVARLIVPGVELHGGQFPELRDAVAAARRAFQTRPDDDPPWLLRLCVRDEWLKKTTLRDRLLDELADLPEAIGVALHVRWARDDVFAERASVEPLAAAVGDLADDDREVFLLKAGVLGWLATAWGASGFSAGLSQKSWLDHTREIKIPGRRGRRPTEWYFEPQLLATFRRSEHNRLRAQAGYQPCDCRFCRRRAAGGAWRNLARQHDLFTLASLADRVQASTLAARRRRVRAIVRQAEQDWQALVPAAGLSGRGQHLKTWLVLL